MMYLLMHIKGGKSGDRKILILIIVKFEKQYRAFQQLIKIMNIRKNNVFIYPIEKVIFPYHQYAFTINSNIYQPEQYDNLIGFATKVDSPEFKNTEIQRVQGVSRYGVLLKIHKSEIGGYRIGDNRTKIIKYNFFGLTFARFRILTAKKIQGCILASVQIFPDDISKETQIQLQRKKLLVNLKKQMKIYYECKLRNLQAQVKKAFIDQQKSVNKLIFRCCSEIDLPVIQKLKLLQQNRQDIKTQILLSALSTKTQKNKLIFDLQQKVRQDLSKQNSKSVLPRMVSSFGGSARNQSHDIQQRLKNKKLPQHVRQQILRQMKRTGGQSQIAVTMKHIQTLLDIPWMQSTEQNTDVNFAEKILNEDHTGLNEVKERIIQFLAVKFRNGNSKGNIICLHGPPGVGKTSIAMSIAKSLGKSFTRVSLGGLNDQAELRGHRRTYVAAMPGVIIRALIKAKSNNPVILLDQIQKMGKGYKGNPEHALLQILDPSQNSSFKDHYVGIPVDLSKVMFICTANSLQMSAPLLNRLELIEVPGYTRSQKLLILKNHLLPNQLKQNGVQDLINFQPQALQQIIKYSNQMGVRQLQRNLGKICRKIARLNQKQTINIEKVQKILGPIKKPQRWKGVGVVNGMAWTQNGGKLLIVQSIKYPSQEFKLQVSGQLGDVMKQSIYIALSWIKANKASLYIQNKFQPFFIREQVNYLQKISLHIHFPAGGIKKDGPSAGVTIVTCLVSLMLKVPVRQNLSMTGQISLNGRVLPVGGVRQKCVAAIYEGIKHIIIPFANTKDLEKIPQQMKIDVKFYPVKTIKQVLKIAFEPLIDKNPSKL